MLQINFAYKTETKTCYRFESGVRPNFTTLYLKKVEVDAAGIDPKNGVTVTIEEADGRKG